MTCREFVEFLMAYLDDELPPSQRREFDRHLARCADCVNYLTSYEETIRLGKLCCGDPEGAPPEDAPDELVRAILAARSKD